MRYDTATILGTTAIVHRVQNFFILAKITIFIENDANNVVFIAVIFLKMIEKMRKDANERLFDDELKKQ